MLFKTKNKKFDWGVFLILFGIITIGVSVVIYMFLYINSAERKFLLQRASTVATILDIKNIYSLSGDATDLSKEGYITIKEQLAKIAKVNPDIRFVYLAQKKSGSIVFLADSESQDSIDYSPPGQIYYEASDKFLDSFESKSEFTEGPVKDRWGYWISALVPIIDPENQNTVAVLGMDVDAEFYVINLIIYLLIPFFATIILIILVLFLKRINKREKEFLELKSEFVAIASHEIRSPLTAINWSLDSLLSNVNNLSTDQKETLQNMLQSSNALLSTVNSFLDLAMAEKGDAKKLFPQKCNLAAILKEISADLFMVSKEKSVSIKFDNLFPDSLEMTCDKEKIKRVLANVISNALKYSMEGGEVLINLRDAVEYAQIDIKDRGIGIPKLEQNNIFKGFYRAKNASGSHISGSGLGLYYAKMILEEHGGKISFVSKEGEGTTFFIKIPKVSQV